MTATESRHLLVRTLPDFLHARSPAAKAGLFLLLVACGLAGNYFKFPVFFGIDFLFGSVFAMLALQLLGLRWGVVAAAAIASITYLLWNHPYAIVIMTAEVAAVGGLMQRRRLGMATAAALYWLFVGMPLVVAFYHFVMGVSAEGTTITMTKQAVNGVANALVARIVFATVWRGTNRSQVSFQELISNLLTAFVLIPALVVLAVGSRADLAAVDANARAGLRQKTFAVSSQLAQWVQDQTRVVVNLATLASSLTNAQMQGRLEQALASDESFQRIGMRDTESVVVAYAPPIDESGQSNVGKKFPERPYIAELRQTLKPLLAEVVMGRINKPEPIANLLAPVLRHGEYAGYVNGVLRVDEIDKQLRVLWDGNLMFYSLLDSKGNVILSSRKDQEAMKPFVRGKGTAVPVEAGISQWVPALSASTTLFEQWRNSSYVSLSSIGGLSGWQLVLEQPVAPFQKALYKDYTQRLVDLGVALLIAMTLAEVLSRRAVAPLARLSALTGDLSNKLAAGHGEVDWPEGGAVETRLLVSNFRAMGDALADQVRQIRQLNESLEQRVQARTADLERSERFSRAVLNSVPALIAVIDREGVIVALNEQWRRGAIERGLEPKVAAPHTQVGANYLAACTVAADASADSATQAREGILAVLGGSLQSFSLEYPCDWEQGWAWYQMTVTPLGGEVREGAVITHTDITERRRSEEAQREALMRLQKIASRVPGVVYQFLLRSDGSFCVPYASDAIEEILCVQPWEVQESADKLFARVHPQDAQALMASIHASARDLTPWMQAFRMVHDDGAVRWVMCNAVPQREADGAVLWHGFCSDITGQRQADEKLRLAASVFTYAREGITITDTQGMIVEVNDAFCRITGYGREEVLGRNPRILNSGRQGKEFYDAMWGDLVGKGHWTGEIWNRRKDGGIYAEMLTISAVSDTQGEPQYYVALFSDITPLKEHAQQLERIVHFDALTALPNRILLADRLHLAMAQAQRRGLRLAVAFLDLDSFKTVNDLHGHHAGDALLVGLAGHMKSVLREGDTLARLGGDEFVAVLVDLDGVADRQPMLQRLLDAASLPVQYGDLSLQVTASLGVTYFPQAEDIDADTLLRQADQAMYQAKLAGKNRMHVFDAEQDRSLRGHHESVERIRQALVDGEFVLHYQPKVNMRTGSVVGAEALIRWQHPERGLVPPAAFLPVIEDHALAIQVGEWVIDTALTQMEVWQAAGLDIPVSVNVSATQLQPAGFVASLQRILAAHPRVAPASLSLEVLETSALEDLAGVSRTIEACSDIGVTFAMDDFGTGYSSLTYLKRLPVAQLKIDQSFVRDMLDDPDDLAILEGVIGLAAAFQREVIAEGVETVEHGALLLQLGCELAQGYGIARPMPADEFPAWAAQWRPDPAWRDLRPVSRDDLPMLFAGVEHHAWRMALEGFLKGERPKAPALDPCKCRFGLWLEGARQTRRGDTPTFAAVDRLHRQVHEVAGVLLDLHARGKTAEALERLGELVAMGDTMVENLKLTGQETIW